jgi:hypothetical protein
MSHSVTPPIVCQSLSGEDPIQLLQYQLQQRFNQYDGPPLTVRANHAIDWHTPMAGGVSDACLPSIAVLEPMALLKLSGGLPHPAQTLDGFRVRWIIDVLARAADTVADTAAETEAADDLRARLYARRAIATYWLLRPDCAELKIYTQPSASNYRHCQVLQVGESATPAGLSGVRLRLQEPVPLYFLTRTLKGQRSHASVALPLTVCDRLS